MHDGHAQRLCTLAYDELMGPLHGQQVHHDVLHVLIHGDEVLHDVDQLMGEQSGEQLDALAQYDELVSVEQ